MKFKIRREFCDGRILPLGERIEAVVQLLQARESKLWFNSCKQEKAKVAENLMTGPEIDKEVMLVINNMCVMGVLLSARFRFIY